MRRNVTSSGLAVQSRQCRRLVAPAVTLLAAVAAGTVLGETWTGIGASNWNDPSKWSGGAIPDGAGSVADFSTIDITSNTAVTIIDAAGDNQIITGTLKIGDMAGANAYTFNLGASQTWTLNGGAQTAVIQKVATPGTGASTVNANITLASDLKLQNDYSGSTLLNVNSVISGNHAVRADGAGPIVLSGASTFAGGFTLASGSIRLGADTVKN